MVQPDSSHVQIGDVIARKYRVERMLGKGGMGVVVAARHVELDELRAIKLMKPAELRNAQAVERFRREARVAARLKSEHAARIFDIETPPDGAAFIVMEYLEGIDLHVLLQQHGAQPIELAVLYIAQACDAVAEAHAARVVHRDLKPANLFLTTRANGSPCIKVLDFGLSKLARSLSSLAQQDITDTQEVMGTPYYMSPEQMRASRDVDERTDVWALGVILYELVTGSKPFPGPTYADVASQVLKEHPPLPSSRRPEVPWSFDRLIVRCLEKDRKRRVSSATELLRELLPFAPSFAPASGSRVSDNPPLAPAAPSSRTRKRRSIRVTDSPVAPPDMYASTVPIAPGLSPAAEKRRSDPAGPVSPKRPSDPAGPVSPKRPSDPGGPISPKRPSDPGGPISPLLGKRPSDRVPKAGPFGGIPAEHGVGPPPLHDLSRPRLGPPQLAHQALRGRDFSGKNLAGADLSGADLSNAKLVGTDLRGALLRDTNLAGADLSSACLLGADLTGAKLSGARFGMAKLVGARISEGALAGCDTFGAALPEPPWIEGTFALVSPCEAIAIEPSGLLLASVHGDGSARLWNVVKGLALRVLPRSADVLSVAFSADGRLLATGHADGSIQIWNLGTGIVDQRADASAPVLCIAFSPDIKTLAAGTSDGVALLVSPFTGAISRTFKGHTKEVRSVAFSPDATLLATASSDATVRLWNLSSGAKQAVLKGHTEQVGSVAWSHDGSRVVTGSVDGMVRIWDAAGKQVGVVTGNSWGRVLGVACGSGSRALLAAACSDGAVRVWGRRAADIITLKGHQAAVTCVAWGPDSTLLVSGSSDGSLRLWDIPGGAKHRGLRGAQAPATLCVAFSGDGSMLACGGDDKAVRLWSMSEGAVRRTLTGHKGGVASVAYSPDGTLATGSFDKTTALWIAPTGTKVATLDGQGGTVRSARWSPDGSVLAAALGDGTIQLWRATSRSLQHTLRGHTGPVAAIAFRRDGTRLVSGSHKSVRQWLVSTGAAYGKPMAHGVAILSVTYSPDGSTIAAGCADGALLLLSSETGEKIGTLPAHTAGVRSVVYSPNGAMIATGSDDSTVALWETATLARRHVLGGQGGSVIEVAWSPDAAALAVASQTGPVRLFSAATGHCIAMLLHLPDGWVALQGDGVHGRMGGDIRGAFWYTVGLCRFELGELDPYLSAPLLLADGTPLIARK